MSLIDQFREEMDAALATLVPQLEGMNDIERMLVGPNEAEARDAVDQLKREYMQRSALLKATQKALADLMTDGYPQSIPGMVNPDIYGKITEQVDTVTAAYKMISVHGEAVSADVSVGQPVPR